MNSFDVFVIKGFTVVNTDVLFNSKKHLQKAFFTKIKINNRKWSFVIKKTGKSVFFLLKICCPSKEPSCRAIFNGNPILQNNE